MTGRDGTVPGKNVRVVRNSTTTGVSGANVRFVMVVVDIKKSSAVAEDATKTSLRYADVRAASPS